MPGELRSIEWAGKGKENILASGSNSGVVQIWDASQGGEGKLLRTWREDEAIGVGGLDWNEHLLSVGLSDGTISLFDTRLHKPTRRVKAHKGKVLGVKWSTDGVYMASGDDLGLVYIWDKRAGKQLLDEATQSSKMRHVGGVKVRYTLSFCFVLNDVNKIIRLLRGAPGNQTFLRRELSIQRARFASGVPLRPPRHPNPSKPSLSIPPYSLYTGPLTARSS